MHIHRIAVLMSPVVVHTHVEFAYDVPVLQRRYGNLELIGVRVVLLVMTSSVFK